MLDGLEDVLSLPARFIDVRYQSTATTSVTVKDGVAKDISSGESEGVSIRVLDRVWGFASSTEVGELMEMASSALKAARTGNREIPFKPAEGVEDKVRVRAKVSPAESPLEDKIELCHRAYSAVEGEKAVASSTFQYLDSTSRGMYASSEGARIEWESVKVAFFSTVYAREGAILQVGSERRGGTGGLELLKEPEETARQAMEKARRLLRAEEAPSGTYKVVLDPVLTGVFIHEALGHAVEADHVLRGESILAGKLHEQVASELVSVCDDPTIPASFGFYLYDSEGMRARRTEVIEEGVLKSYLHSRETSSALEAESTGNARSQSYEHPPLVRMSNTCLEPGDCTLEELLEDVRQGVYLLGSRGGEVDPAKGVFQFAAEEGFLIEKGELTAPVKDVALSGETLSILKSIDGVGRELSHHIGFCGKEGQSVPVGDGGAHVRTLATVGGAR